VESLLASLQGGQIYLRPPFPKGLVTLTDQLPYAHIFNRSRGTCETTSSGRVCNGCPIKKWLGVNGMRSFGCDESGVSGREFNIPSMRVTNVSISSNVRT